MIRLTGYIDVPAERYADVAAALPEHIALTRAEPGNLTFHVTENPTVPHRYEISETFVDKAAFEFHQARAGASPWAEITKGIPRNFKIEDIAD
ncbi:MAG: antibiotic biosynthesis monooxygenase [Cognatishimia sp.]|uniref:putative quinol monooxygenase n=1 Tax=Cognatishimia sp. TaxID=2211648 RepID=UPI003B8BF279